MSTHKTPLISPDELQQPISSAQKPTRIASAVDVEALRSELERNVEGEVRFDPGTKAMYAVDASNYRQVPIGVVIPKTKEDVVQTIAACRKFGAPVLSRGGGTSLAGECCNVAIVIDWSKYMHGVLELDQTQRWARVLPGTVCDQLRDKALKETDNKLNWGPDPATHNHCCFGGMIGNNSCGAHAQMSGKTSENVLEMEILLYDGTRLTVGEMDEAALERAINAGGREGEIYAGIKRLRDRYGEMIRKRYPDIPRRVSGYNLDKLLPDEHGHFNVAQALVGSEGTLVTVLEAKCRLIDARIERVILMLGYEDVYSAADHVMEILPFNPTALEGMDDKLIDNIKKKGGPHTKYLHLLPEGKGWLMAEFGADKKSDAEKTAREVMAKLNKGPNPPSMNFMDSSEEMHHMWTVRESGLGATAFVPGEPNTWPGWEDSAVAPDKLGGYLRDLRALYNKYNYSPALYGHFGQGCVHCRVDFDLMTEPGLRKWRAFMEEATDLCVKYNGSLSGEHGDGQARGEFLYKMFGDELIQAFREFKTLWDPDWKMNPGKVVDPYTLTQNLRLGTNYAPWQPKTHFQFPDDHGDFSHAALRCVGVGKCRREKGEKPGDDTMCPSFMVTHEERHTTRGRAHHLWEMLNGDVLNGGWRDDSVKESLDLCLSCKGCKGDCPVNVDMATYKAEFLSHYWEGRLRPRYAYAFGFIDQWARLASIAPGMVNLFTQTPLLRTIAKKAAGMPTERKIPEFAPETFKAWFKKREVRNQGKQQIILWADTFNNNFFPETAQAAVEVLEHAGFQVKVPQQHLCCGRPLYDYGFLDEAKRYLNNVLNGLQSEIAAGTPIVALEPSCCSVFRDELHGMMPHSEQAQRLAKNTFMLSEFLEKCAPSYRPPKYKRKTMVQGHCHHKAIMRLDDEKSLLKKMEMDLEILPSGCCGMAGSFGFEAEKYDTSIAIGEHALLPAVRKAGLSTTIIADGFSCREQISQGSDRHALHVAEVMRIAQNEGERGGKWILPEQEIVERRQKGLRRAKFRALFTLAAGAAALFAFRYLNQAKKEAI